MAQILAKSTSYLRRYERAAQNHPLATKCATCLVGFAIGDVVAQSISRPPSVPITTDGITIRQASMFDGIDPLRTVRMALFGALIAAPQMHVFFHWLEKVRMAHCNLEQSGVNIVLEFLSKAVPDQYSCMLYRAMSDLQFIMPKNPTHPVAVASKVAADQLINSPIGTMTFFAWTQSLRGTPDRIPAEVSEKLVPTTLAGWRLWPAAQAVNFFLIPIQYRIIFINIVAVGWTCMLSRIGN